MSAKNCITHHICDCLEKKLKERTEALNDILGYIITSSRDDLEEFHLNKQAVKAIERGVKLLGSELDLTRIIKL